MKRVLRYTNSATVASINLLLGLAAFLCLLFPRFTDWGLKIISVTFFAVILTAILFLRDLWNSGSRLRALAGLLLSLPMLLLYGLLAVWEGPLYVTTKGEAPIMFRVQGAAGFHGFEIYGPDTRRAEWTSDEVGFIWGFAWESPRQFPPMKLEFSCGTVPRGFQEKKSMLAVALLVLDPEVTYTLHLQPAMGMPEYYSLHGSQIAEYKPDLTVCWGSLPVGGRPPATVRVDCATRKPLPMSRRGMDRIRDYQQGKLVFF